MILMKMKELKIKECSMKHFIYIVMFRNLFQSISSK